MGLTIVESGQRLRRDVTRPPAAAPSTSRRAAAPIPNILLENDRPAVPRVKSSVRVLEVFEYFQREVRPSKATEISRALQLPNSSVDRILKTLVHTGYLLFDWRSKRYKPSYRLIRAGHRLEDGFFGGRMMRELLATVREKTGEPVFMCLQNDCWVECVVTMPGLNGNASTAVEGMKFSIDESSPGVALLSLKNQLEIVEIVRRADKMSTPPRRRSDYGDVLAAAERARIDGFCVRKGGSFEGAVAVSVPVRHPGLSEPVSIGFVGRNPSGSPERNQALGNQLREIVAHALAQ
jgi:DNA-binding IclR family transcriptional regulator